MCKKSSISNGPTVDARPTIKRQCYFFCNEVLESYFTPMISCRQLVFSAQSNEPPRAVEGELQELTSLNRLGRSI